VSSDSKILNAIGRMGPAWIIAADACGLAIFASLSIAGEEKNAPILNSFGGMTLLVTIFLALRFIASKLGLFS
jgi:hypothetical protein